MLYTLPASLCTISILMLKLSWFLLLCRKEADILVDMFGAQVYMAEWNFLQSLMLLQSAQIKLSAWSNPASSPSQVSY